MKHHIFFFIVALFFTIFCGYGQERPEYSVYLIGDTGAPNISGPDEVFTNLKKNLDQERDNSAIIFLGDNIYHNGLPPLDYEHEAENRVLAERKLLVQLKAIDSFKGKIYFIPGNHDWNEAHSDGIDYIRAQEEYIEFFLDRGDVLIPDHGCPGPEKKKLGDNILLIAMDSQWWLHPHTDEQRENADCKNKSIGDIIQELKEMLDENDEKQIIIALHHPIYSDGSHNGFFTPKDHLFPLQALNSKLWIPLPGIGSLYPFYRGAFGARQDMAHPLYRTLREEILNLIFDRKNIIFASGHEHNLQYYFVKDNHFIKSGSGSKASRLPKKTSASFSSDTKGYAKLEYFKNRKIDLKYFIIIDGKEIEKYSETISEAAPAFGIGHQPPVDVQSITIEASNDYNKGGLHKLFFGAIYRKDWASPVSFRSIDLSKERGGLNPIKIGGGLSSISIRLKSNDKKEYVLRSVEKGVAKVVPKAFRKSVIQDIFQDQIAGSQPYGALLVPPLANAIGVYHTNPELVHLPYQSILGGYNDEYADKLYLYEERPSGNQKENSNFGSSGKIISFSKMIEKIQSSSKHHIHQEQVLKSRILDIFLGDWDRHDDQWRWASFTENSHGEDGEKRTYYEPIPRDRDQVMFKYQGLMPTISKLLSPELRKFQSFGPDIKNLNYLNFNARFFDRSYLTELEKPDWISMSDMIAENLTESVIGSALDRLPEPIQDLRRKEYEVAFNQRRKKLKKWALQHYSFLARYVDVVGTNKDELFEIDRNADGHIGIKVYQITKKGKKDDLLYDRIFSNQETKEVRLFGLEGKDIFHVIGSTNKGPIVRIIGGKGNDELTYNSSASGKRKNLVVYDKISDNGMGPAEIGIDKRSDDYQVNLYDRMEFYYDATIGIPFIGFNPDDGLILQYTHSLSKYGFRKKPYKTKHTFGFRYAFNNTQLSMDYTGHFVDIGGNADFGLDAYLNLPDNVSNFFGLSNTRTFSVGEFSDFDFFRYARTDLGIHPSFMWSTKRDVSTISIGPYYRYVNVEDNIGKFVADRSLSKLLDADFETSNNIGLRGSYKLMRIDNQAYPTAGVNFIFTPSYNINLSGNREHFTSLYGSLTLYNYLWIPRPFVLASKIEAGVIWGDFNFYQGNYIGLENGLRAFRNNRFGGKSSLLFSNDLRIKLGTTGGTFPLSIGLIGTYDIGRVWNDGIDSDTWHKSYGGGFFISPFDLMPISFYFSKSTEDTTNFLIKLGFAI